MPISFQCTSCQKDFKVPSKLAGKKIRCKGCNGVTRVPQKPAGSTSPQPAPATAAQPVVATPVPPAAAAPPDDFVAIEVEAPWIVKCDDCGREHKPERKLMGKRIRCKCGSVLHLLEKPAEGIPLAPLEPELADAPVDYGIQPVFQAPPPTFQKKPKSIRDQRRAEAEAMVRAADEKQQWRAQLKEEDDETKWGATGKIIGGVLSMAIGAGVSLALWQAGYIWPYGWVLVGLGALSICVGIVESMM